MAPAQRAVARRQDADVDRVADRFPALRSYSAEQLAALTPGGLLDLMYQDGGRVPRAVIDACARHGDRMVEALEVLDGPYDPDEEEPGAWSAKLHAVMVLGLVPTEAAGLLAVLIMRPAAEMEDCDLQDWLATGPRSSPTNPIRCFPRCAPSAPIAGSTGMSVRMPSIP